MSATDPTLAEINHAELQRDKAAAERERNKAYRLVAERDKAIAERDAAREIIVNLTSNPAGGHYETCASCRGSHPCDCGWTEALMLSADVLSGRLTEGQEA